MKGLIVFDLDETLVNPTGMYAEYVRARTKDVASRLGTEEAKAEGIVRTLRTHGFTSEEIYDLFDVKEGELTGRGLWRSRILSIDPSAHVTPDPETNSALNSLKARFRLVIVTGAPVEQTLRVLSAATIDPILFDKIIAWEKDGIPPKGTNSNATFSKVLREFDADPNKTFAVGNEIKVDLKPFKDLDRRITTILVGGDPFSNKEDMKYVDRTIKEIHEIGKAVEGTWTSAKLRAERLRT